MVVEQKKKKYHSTSLSCKFSTLYAPTRTPLQGWKLAQC